MNPLILNVLLSVLPLACFPLFAALFSTRDPWRSRMRSQGGYISIGRGSKLQLVQDNSHEALKNPLHPDNVAAAKRRRAILRNGGTLNANSLAGVNLAAISEETLDPLTSELFPVQFMARDFSDVTLNGGSTSVTTRIPSTFTCSDVSSGWSFTDVTTTAVTITLDKERGAAYKFTDAEVAKAKSDPRFLLDMFVGPATAAVGLDFLTQFLALFNTTNYDDASQKSVITAANFTVAKVNALKTKLSNQKVPLRRNSKGGRYLIINPDYAQTLGDDATLQKKISGGNQPLFEEGFIGRLYSFDIWEFTDIPANSISLTAIAGIPNAAAVAARRCPTPEGTAAEIQNMTHAASNFPYQIRMWYDNENMLWKMGLKYMGGFAKGVKLAAHLVTSA